MTITMKKGVTAKFESGLRLHLIAADEVPAPETFLSDSELERSASFKAEKRRRDWLGGRYAAKTLIREGLPPGTPLSGIKIAHDAFGRPVRHDCKGRTQLISITHSGPFCAAACAEEGAVFIGIDLERAEPRTAAWYKDYFHKGELPAQRHDALPPYVLATRLWTQKEALLKALGLGLKADLLDIYLGGEKPGFSRSAAARYEELGRPPFRLHTLEYGPDYILAMAWQTGSARE